MSHLKKESAFYGVGITRALEKLGILKEVGTALRTGWEALNPSAQLAAKRMALGAGVGGVGGSVLDTPGGALGGAALGAGVGLGAHKGLGFLKHRGHTSGAKQLGLFEGRGNALDKARTAAATKARTVSVNLDPLFSPFESGQLNLFK